MHLGHGSVFAGVGGGGGARVLNVSARCSGVGFIPQLWHGGVTGDAGVKFDGNGFEKEHIVQIQVPSGISGVASRIRGVPERAGVEDKECAAGESEVASGLR